MLVGHVSRDIDINVLRENWERNYPVRHIDGLPDFIEITAGNIRMFYPTCYVYKIGSIDETNSSNESTPPPPLPNKKSDISSTKKSKIPPSTTNLQSTSIDLITNNNKNENILIKNLSNQLLISAQRNNCIDIEKKYFVIFFVFFRINYRFCSLDKKINVY